MPTPEYLVKLHAHYRRLAAAKASTLTADETRSLVYFRAEGAIAADPDLYAEAKDRVTVWVLNAQRVDTFLRENGVLPRRNSGRPLPPGASEERRITWWLEDQRRPSAQYRQCSYQRERLGAFPGIDIRPQDQRWDDRLENYEGFIRIEGRAPLVRSEDPDERSLARWATKQRQLYRRKALPEERVTALRALPIWTWGSR